MADQFQTYDKAPIVGQTITLRSWRVGIRELALAVSALVLFVLVLVLAALLGTSSQQLQDARTEAQTQRSNTCKDSGCLKTMAHLASMLNTSSSPCDNFFQFACGSFDELNPLDPATSAQTILRQTGQANQDRLMDILAAPTDKFTTWSSEKKLKDFYKSCTDDFTREQLKGQPFLNKVLPLMGGWYVLSPTWTDSATSWNFDSSLKAVQTDLWLDAFFSPGYPNYDTLGSKKFIISIYPGGSGRYMSWSDYKTVNPTPRQQKIQADYKQFMRTVATMMARDANANDQDVNSRIEVFVGDAYEVESDIAKFASNSRYDRNAFSEERKVTLDQLKAQTNNQIDWTSQMAYLFNEAGVTGSTKVVEAYPTYLNNLTAMIQQLAGPNGNDMATRNRKLHNYLMWRVLEVYVQDLSWEYVHANRQFYVDKYGAANFLGTQRYCFYNARSYFDIALGVLYVDTHFERKNKDKVTDITETVKTALENMITTNNWMDQQTKDYAIDKMKASTYKIGYPDFMDDETKVDAIYSQLNINASDFFGNLLALNQQQRREWNRRLREGEDRSEWIYNTFDTNLAVYWYWDEIIVPAGILQFPFYTYDMPHYYSFGSIGTLIGHFVHHLIDEYGRRWDKGGDLMDTANGWWSNQTVDNYNTARQCVADVYNNRSQGPYIDYNGEQTTIDVNGDQFATEAMAITTGIRLAYNAYELWQGSHGTDPYPPGLTYTPEQLFFIGHAQVWCYNRDPLYDYLYTTYYNANEETRVNVALQELPEFRQAFNCKAGDKMVSPKPCTYY